MARQIPVTEKGWATYHLTVRQYVKMIVAGIFPDDAHVELLGGVLVDHGPKQAPHNFTVSQIGSKLGRVSPIPWFIREEKSLVLGRSWRPEPDVVVIRGPNERYRAGDPKASDVALLAEVSESTYALDRGEKWRAYAAARVPVYWIVNLPKRRVEVYRDPAGRGKAAAYRSAEVFGVDAEVPVAVEGSEVGRIPVRDVLP